MKLPVLVSLFILPFVASSQKGFIYTEESEKVPVLIYKPVNSILKSFPVVICLHGLSPGLKNGFEVL